MAKTIAKRIFDSLDAANQCAEKMGKKKGFRVYEISANDGRRNLVQKLRYVVGKTRDEAVGIFGQDVLSLVASIPSRKTSNVLADTARKQVEALLSAGDEVSRMKAAAICEMFEQAGRSLGIDLDAHEETLQEAEVSETAETCPELIAVAESPAPPPPPGM